MRNVMKESEKELLYLDKILKKVDSFLAQAPEGCLKWQKKGGKTYYYHQYKAQDTWKRRYISGEEPNLARELAKKHYYNELRKNIQKKKTALTGLVVKWPYQEMDAIYDELCEERKRLVDPIRKTVQQRVEEFQDEIYEKNMSHPENLRYETDQGELVRSKSEAIIANMLYQRRDVLVYKYEKPLRLVVGGNEKTIYPDFTIMNRHNGKLFYWEHAGLMEDASYAGKFVRKMNAYVQNDLVPGKAVIVTYESNETPLAVGVVRRMIQTMLAE